MTTLTLLAKTSSANRLKQIDKTLKFAFEGLEAEAKILGTVADRWVQITLEGEDEGIATSYVTKEIGVCPNSLESVKKFSALKGYVTHLEKSNEELLVDVGVFQPKIVHAAIPLRNLQAQLVDGRKTALKRIAELFGFCEDLPLNVKITSVNEEENRLEAELSHTQVKKYAVWQESLLDKLIVLGSSNYEVKMMIEREELDRDIIGIEPLGMLEHALTCKLGTDAAGLIPKIGRNLRNAKFVVFNPKRLRQFLEV